MTDTGNDTKREMPRYLRKRKHVWALKIKRIDASPKGGVDLIPEEENYGPIHCSLEFFMFYRPTADGYYLIYGDGNPCWVPEELFKLNYESY